MTSIPSNASQPSLAASPRTAVRRARAGGRWAVPMLVLAAAFGAAACSEDSAAPTPTVELTPTSTPITTEPSTTTTAAPSTDAPTTTEDPRISEIEAAVAGFRDAQVRVLRDPTSDVSLMAEFAEGELLAAATANTLKYRAEGRTVEGVFERTTIEIRIETEDRAQLTECGLDALAAFDANGAEVTSADVEPFVRTLAVEFEAASDSWKVSSIVFAGEEKQPCEL